MQTLSMCIYDKNIVKSEQKILSLKVKVELLEL